MSDARCDHVVVFWYDHNSTMAKRFGVGRHETATMSANQAYQHWRMLQEDDDIQRAEVVHIDTLFPFD